MGGWLMLLAAIERPSKVSALIGIASAPDFTEDLIWDKLSPTQQKELQETGSYNLKSDYGDAPYPITMELIEDGRKHLLLKKSIGTTRPVRLIHGQKDADVPSSISTRLAEKLVKADVVVNLIENGDHRMSTPQNIQLLCDTLEDVIQKQKL